MSLILAALFASSAVAQLTTSIWMPFPYGNDDIVFQGSVVAKDGDHTTLAVMIDEDTKPRYIRLRDDVPATLTVGGSTYFAAETTTSISGDLDYTVSLRCTANTAEPEPTCTYSAGGNGLRDVICADYTSYTEVVTTTYEHTYSSDEFGPATTRTFTETYDYRDGVPDYCVTGSTIPEDMLANTQTVSWDPYKIVITAGQEKLEATAGSSPSTTSAQVTGTSSSISSGTASASASQSGPSSAASSAPEETGAASPMRPVAPVLVGLGAAAAAAWLM